MLLPKRIWKDIPGYEGLYQVSNTGQIRSLNYRRTGKTKILKQYINNTGYKQVGLRKNGKGKQYLVHRLVAQAFIPNPNNYPIINHKDENPANNAVWNLEYCTQQYNCNYGTINERKSKTLKGKPLTEEHKKKLSVVMKIIKPNAKAVLMFSKNDEFIRRFDSVAEANEFLGKDRKSSVIHNCLLGYSASACSYIWKYEEDCK